MNWQASLAEPAIEAALSWLVQRRSSASGTERWLGRAAVALGVIAAGAAVTAFWMWLAERFPMETAMALFALGTAAMAAICLGVSVWIRNYREYREDMARRRAIETARLTSLTVADSLESAVIEYPKTMTALALVAGLILSGHALAGTEKAMTTLDENLRRHNSGGIQ